MSSSYEISVGTIFPTGVLVIASATARRSTVVCRLAK
jgi:hypothetical protein